MLAKYFTPEVMGETCNFSPSGIYHSPTDTDLTAVR
jgi:hypothetical protein